MVEAVGVVTNGVERWRESETVGGMACTAYWGLPLCYVKHNSGTNFN